MYLDKILQYKIFCILKVKALDVIVIKNTRSSEYKICYYILNIMQDYFAKGFDRTEPFYAFINFME